MSRIVNLKTPIIVRTRVVDKDAAFSIKTFLADRASHIGIIPEPSDRVTYAVSELVLGDVRDSWYRLETPTKITVAWSHVISEQDA